MSFDPPSELEAYTRVRELVIESPYIDPSDVLDAIPANALLELQALLHERKRSFRSALAIYIQRLHDLTLAEKLCDRVFEEEKSSSKRLEKAYTFDFSEHTDNLYMDMIRIYLEPEAATGIVRELTNDEWRDLSVLLCRKRYRINIEEMFELLPGNVDMSVLMQFIEAALRTLAEQQRNLLIVHSLYTSENLFLKEQLIRCHQRMIVIRDESAACCICHKRIGSAVFVAYPDGSLAHIACYTRLNKAESSAFASRTPSSYQRSWE